MMRLLFVCTGNICRSPTAEGVMRQHIRLNGLDQQIGVDSAGTHGYHVGEGPDLRACEAALKRGIDLSVQRARKVIPEDFERFNLLLAMDRDNLAFLKRNARPEYHDRLGLFMAYATRFREDEVPDPYYGGPQGFERVLDMVDDAASGLIEALRHPPQKSRR